MRHGGREQDRLQCTAKTDRGGRCTRVGTHSNGGTAGVLCEMHHQLYMVKRANDAPIRKPR